MADHDQNFKNLILDYPRPALEFFAPEEAVLFPPHVKITPIRQEQLKNRLGDRFRELDVPLLIEYPNAERDAILFIIEEQSWVDRWWLHRLAIYCFEISMLFKTRRVVPVAIYPFADKPVESEIRLSGDAGDYAWFRCLSKPLGCLLAKEHFASNNIVERLCLTLMKGSDEEQYQALIQAMDGLVRFEPNLELRAKYLEFVKAYSGPWQDSLQYEELERICLKQNPNREDVMSLLQQLEDRGIRKGMEKGRQEGLVAGILRAFLRLAEDGTISREKAREKIELAVNAGEVSRADADRALEQLGFKK